jgi:hypothetical protein
MWERGKNRANRSAGPAPKSRLYSIEIKDAKTDQVVVIAAADWTEDQKRLGALPRPLEGRMERGLFVELIASP